MRYLIIASGKVGTISVVVRWIVVRRLRGLAGRLLIRNPTEAFGEMRRVLSVDIWGESFGMYFDGMQMLLKIVLVVCS